MKLLTSPGPLSQWTEGGTLRSGMTSSVREAARKHRQGGSDAHGQEQAGKMKVIKQGGHRLFEQDTETAATVSAMLRDLEKNGMDAVRRYSEQFDGWVPESFRLNPAQIEAAIAEVSEQAIQDTDYCQENVRRFAEAQLTTIRPLEVNIRPGVTLGHSTF